MEPSGSSYVLVKLAPLERALRLRRGFLLSLYPAARDAAFGGTELTRSNEPGRHEV
jgi:hypothetical protein